MSRARPLWWRRRNRAGSSPSMSPRGAEVKPGDVLFTLDTTREQAARDNAAAQVATAEAAIVQMRADVEQTSKELERQQCAGAHRRHAPSARRAGAGGLRQRRFARCPRRVRRSRRCAPHLTQPNTIFPSASCMRRSRAACRISSSVPANTRAPGAPVVSILPPELYLCAVLYSRTRGGACAPERERACRLRRLRGEPDRTHHLHRRRCRNTRRPSSTASQPREAGVQGRSARAGAGRSCAPACP